MNCSTYKWLLLCSEMDVLPPFQHFKRDQSTRVTYDRYSTYHALTISWTMGNYMTNESQNYEILNHLNI